MMAELKILIKIMTAKLMKLKNTTMTIKSPVLTLTSTDKVGPTIQLSTSNEAYYKENPHLIGEPLGYSILDGQYYCNSRISNGTLATGGVKTVVVINYDKHPITGEKIEAVSMPPEKYPWNLFDINSLL